MSTTGIERVGFTCAYTPLAIVDAVGYAPYRILPIGDHPDRAGGILHDNLCPHVKEVLNIAIAGDLPDLAGVVFVNSCDAMRRLADGWQRARPKDRLETIDLPVSDDDSAKRFLSIELERLMNVLCEWAGRRTDKTDLKKAVERFNSLCAVLEKIDRKIKTGQLGGGSGRMLDIYNRASRQPIGESLDTFIKILQEPGAGHKENEGLPIYIFGNVLPDPGAIELFESCGARIAGDDFCTGSRVFQPIEIGNLDDIYIELAAGLLERPPCARTISCKDPGRIAREVIQSARDCGAKGVIGHTLKFCDPYLARVPALREELKAANIPFLFLEGDCSLRSMGQQRTRIEAFIEMLR
ncbi:2-hydroxyacyl-CoA dehydratase subunit D [Thermodesulfobacteriota bacterium]